MYMVGNAFWLGKVDNAQVPHSWYMPKVTYYVLI